MQYLKKIITNPVYYFGLALSILRGSYYILFYKITNRNVIIKFPFLVSSRVNISGPGKVYIGPRCVVVENVFRGLIINTYSNGSEVVIGNKCMLAGLTIYCSGKVTIGDNVMTAVSLVQDSFFQNINDAQHRLTGHYINSSPINIHNNVWIGGHCIVLGGSQIGDNSVLSAYTVLYDREIKPNSLVSGNPVKRPLPIEQVLKLRNTL